VSEQQLESVALAVEPALGSARRRRRRARLAGGAAPYALLLPALAVIVAVLGYPLYKIVALSFQKYGLFELIRHSGTWIGADNYTRILHDRTFWDVLARTVAFTVVNVGLTMVLGTLVALLLAALGTWMRLLLTTGLVLVWAMPPVVSVNIWSWMVDYEFGVANWTLTKLHLGNFVHHDWFTSPVQGFAVITAIVVWGAIPFVAITVYAGLTQLPRELVEAAEVDGANAFRVFRDMTLPILKPIFVILTSLSVIWDFQVFTQIWVIRNYRPESSYFLISIYSFVTSFNQSNYGLGSAIALVMLALMLCVTFFYIRQMIRIGEVR
jgi:N,N'-diacetylchitobiose transport system permease protein